MCWQHELAVTTVLGFKLPRAAVQAVIAAPGFKLPTKSLWLGASSPFTSAHIPFTREGSHGGRNDLLLHARMKEVPACCPTWWCC